MTPGDLLKLTGALLLAALIFQPKDDDAGSDVWLGLRRAARDLALNAAAATSSAALLLWLLPQWRPEGLWNMTLAELRQQNAEATEWLQRAWYLPMAGALLWLAAAVATGATVWGARAGAFGESIKWTLRLKAVAALLALFCLTTSGLQFRAHQLVEAQEARVKDLSERRIALANDAVRAALVAVAAPMAEAIASVPVVSATAPAYWAAEPYLSVPAWPPVKRSATHSSAADVERAMRDLSTSQAQLAQESLAKAFEQAPDDAQRLVTVVLEAAFDQGVAEPVRDALLSIDNPLLNELVAAALDPLIAQPLREAVLRLASVAVQAGGAAELKSAATAWWSTAGNAVRQRWKQAATQAQPAWEERTAVPLGQPQWQSARARLAELVRSRSTDLEGFEYMLAGGASLRMGRLWGALDSMLVTPTTRRDLAERAAASMMLHTGLDTDGAAMTRYTALWGQALAEAASPFDLRSFKVGTGTKAGSFDARGALLRYYSSQGKVLSDKAQRSFGSANGKSPDALVRHVNELHVQSERGVHPTTVPRIVSRPVRGR